MSLNAFHPLVGGLMYSGVTGLRADDRVYCVLPLYHSSGSKLMIIQQWGSSFYSSIKIVIVTTAVALQAGATIVLGRKFSASRFWDDCTKYNVTAFTVCRSKITYTCRFHC